MKSLTTNTTYNSTMLSAESTRQSVCNVAGATQAQVNTGQIAYFRSLLAAGLANGLDVGVEIAALKNLGATV
jgi:hypothetical protein